LHDVTRPIPNTFYVASAFAFDLTNFVRLPCSSHFQLFFRMYAVCDIDNRRSLPNII